LRTNLDLVRLISTDNPKLEVERVKDSLSALVGAAEGYSKFKRRKEND